MRKKERLVDKNFIKDEEKNWGKGTIVCKSWDEFDRHAQEHDGRVLSPGGAAARLDVSRSYINQLEKEGKIRAYRIIVDSNVRESLPFWMRIFAPTKNVFIVIPSEDIERIKQEMISRAEKRLKELKRK
jgi:hypothetical protein